MSKYSTLIKRVSNATAATALTLASLTPAVMLGGSAKAAQIATRSIEMSSSLADANSVTYTVTTSGVAPYDLELCTSPLFDVACVTPAGATATASTNINDEATIDNPSNVGTFYVRITDDNGDTGAVAMSTTSDVTINARVQEQLTFCVGSDSTSNILSRSDCTGSWNQTVDLGVVSTKQESPVPTASPDLGNDETGFFVLRTNASHGARVAYTPASELKVSGVTCGTSTSTSDQCFNNTSGLPVASLAGGTEAFGMSIYSISHMGSAEGVTGARLSADSNYNNKYKWDMSAGLHTIATATEAVDWDVAQVNFGAATAANTPSGSYSTSANFVATGLF